MDPVDSFYGALSGMVDQINMMTYGMADAWGGWKSWHSAAVFGDTPSTPSSIDRYTKAYVSALAENAM